MTMTDVARAATATATAPDSYERIETDLMALTRTGKTLIPTDSVRFMAYRMERLRLETQAQRTLSLTSTTQEG